MADQWAHRTGQSASDPRVRADAGALLGALIAVALNCEDSPDAGYGSAFGEVLRATAHGVLSARLGPTALLGPEPPWPDKLRPLT
ncbi:hypothetical protein [Streptomyces himalayensis]|uniref:hypothetical protein n=1 Tax=Streptomyces himalayensis TaxID=2820085 RepID=UPI0035A9A14F